MAACGQDAFNQWKRIGTVSVRMHERERALAMK